MTDREKILEYLQSGKCLTCLNAFRHFQTLSLPQHIKALRLQGHDIKTEMIIVGKNKKRVAMYSIPFEF